MGLTLVFEIFYLKKKNILSNQLNAHFLFFKGRVVTQNFFHARIVFRASTVGMLWKYFKTYFENILFLLSTLFFNKSLCL